MWVDEGGCGGVGLKNMWLDTVGEESENENSAKEKSAKRKFTIRKFIIGKSAIGKSTIGKSVIRKSALGKSTIGKPGKVSKRQIKSISKKLIHQNLSLKDWERKRVIDRCIKIEWRTLL